MEGKRNGQPAPGRRGQGPSDLREFGPGQEKDGSQSAQTQGELEKIKKGAFGARHVGGILS